jgi:hypothetical protein
MLILNEEQFAKEIYEGVNKDVKSILQKTGYVTRYLLHSLHKSDEDNYKETIRWLQKYHVNFDESYYSNFISDAIKRAHKHQFYHIDNINITQSELDIISSLDNLRAEKILFVLLCMAKQQSVAYGFTNGLVRYSITDVCKMARISVPSDDREYILHYIIQHGLLGYPLKNDTKCLIVKFIDDGDAALKIDNIDCQELAYVYLNWKNKGEGYTRCTKCNKLCKQSKTKPRKYCEACAHEVHLEIKRLSEQRRRYKIRGQNLTRQNE